MNFVSNELTNFILSSRKPEAEVTKKCDDAQLGTLAAAIGLIALTALFNFGLILTAMISAVTVLAIHDISIIIDRTKELSTTHFSDPDR